MPAVAIQERVLIRARRMKDKMIKAQVDIVARELDVNIGIGGDK